MIIMGVLVPILQILWIYALQTGVQGMTTQSPETIGARLVDGTRPSEGRVEVYYQGQWGTVCDNLFRIQEADVVCKQLGYIGADQVDISGQFGEGSGDVLLDMVQCNGEEENLFDCSHDEIGTTACNHTEDVGVICTSTGSLRLRDGTSYRNGRLEILTANQEWGTVCDESWDYKEEYAACYQLGFHEGYGGSFTAPSGTGPIELGGIECGFVEIRLDSCPRDDTWTPESCTHEQDVGLECISLVDFDAKGYVEEGIPTIYYAGRWGSICADNWNMDSARIFCRNAGFEDALSASTTDANETLDILLNPKSCTGDEDYYTECSEAEWAYQDGCNQPNVNPYVRCQLVSKYIELVPPSGDAPFYTSGRVIVNFGSELGASICNRTWTQEVADVVCRDAGFMRGARRFFTIGGGTGEEVFDNIRCTGNEERFSECRSELVPASSGCDHSHDAGVECYGLVVPTSILPEEPSIVTFLSGSGAYEGVVFYYPGEDRDALICDETWTDNEAAVACRMRLLEGGTATNVVDLRPGDFSNVFQWDFECNGDEESLENCTVTKTENSTTCSPEYIAQVQCEPSPGITGFRMAGSDHPEQGRLEYFADDEWLAVWIDEDTLLTPYIYSAICLSMGYDEELYHYRGANEMPFEEGDQGARFVISEGLEILARDSAMDRNYQTGIVCKPFDDVAYHPVRLVDLETGEVSDDSGLVEIYNEGEWGNICQSQEYYYSSEKLCSELGFEDATNAVHLDVGESTSTKWFSVSPGPLNEYCNKLYGCPHTAWGHILDECIPLAVNCQPSPDGCSSDPCLNGGTCSVSDSDLAYTCRCPAGFKGDTCENQINGCSSDPCLNGGTCSVSDADLAYTCRCTTGFKGDTCENRGSSLEGLARSLIVMVVVVTLNLVFVDV